MCTSCASNEKTRKDDGELPQSPRLAALRQAHQPHKGSGLTRYGPGRAAVDTVWRLAFLLRPFPCCQPRGRHSGERLVQLVLPRSARNSLLPACYPSKCILIEFILQLLQPPVAEPGNQ